MRNSLITLAAFLCLSCSTKGDEPENTVTFKHSEPYQLATGFEFTEGPVWCTDGYLLFSDVNANTIYKYSEESGVTAFCTPSGNSNGIDYDGSYFWVCRHGARDVARVSKTGGIESVVSTYQSKRLNSPNDLAVSRSGDIYFSDPAYGVLSENRELAFEGLFFWKKSSQQLTLVEEGMIRPNGVCLSTDQKRLYVAESGTNRVYVYDIAMDGTPVNKQIFSSLGGEGEVDGIACHEKGYLLVAFGDGGLVVLNPEGEQIDVINFPPKEKVRNLCFNGDLLFVTA
ncbi:MAG: SMP-30/gluconolactonase/LRE family protein, partial [Bacteroidales bacterium]